MVETMMEFDTIYNMDCLEGMRQIPDGSIDCCVTSPPYYLQRDYGCEGQIGLEDELNDYIAKLVEVFREVRRILKPDGTLWLNIGDGYAAGTTAVHTQSNNPGVGANRADAQNSVRRPGNPNGCKTKDMIGVPWLLAFALRADGWYLRQDIIWNKPNAMPESVKDRCTKSHEYIFLMSKSERYHVNFDMLREPAVCGISPREFTHIDPKRKFTDKGENSDGQRTRRDVWNICVTPGYEGHKAGFPVDLPRLCIAIGCKPDGVGFDPFMGSGTTAIACIKERRHFIGFELSKEYFDKAVRRIKAEQSQLTLF